MFFLMCNKLKMKYEIFKLSINLETCAFRTRVVHNRHKTLLIYLFNRNLKNFMLDLFASKWKVVFLEYSKSVTNNRDHDRKT